MCEKSVQNHGLRRSKFQALTGRGGYAGRADSEVIGSRAAETGTGSTAGAVEVEGAGDGPTRFKATEIDSGPDCPEEPFGASVARSGVRCGVFINGVAAREPRPPPGRPDCCCFWAFAHLSCSSTASIIWNENRVAIGFVRNLWIIMGGLEE